MDFDALREEGLQHIRRLAGEHWTDHNTHDPGVTILEQLCYALTDLDYRAGFPIEDLMAEGGQFTWGEAFYPRQMLASGPVSLSDWRRLLLDIPGVRNAWIRPVDTTDGSYPPALYYDQVAGTLSLQAPVGKQYADPLSIKGLYRVDYVLEEDHQEAVVTASIRRVFHAHRNLCEGLFRVAPLSELFIKVSGQVEMADYPAPETILANIYTKIHDYFSPGIRFHSLQEMQAKGYYLDEIFTGPRLEHGFLTDEELARHHLRETLHVSSLIQQIMEVEGVEAVAGLQLYESSEGSSEPGAAVAGTGPEEPWVFHLPPDKVLRFHWDKGARPTISLLMQGVEREVDWATVQKRVHAALAAHKKKKRPLEELDAPPPRGMDREVGLHQSILHQFPEIYGIGNNGLPLNSGPARQAKARQLKAYLSFFDQLLANGFAQLAGLRTLFELKEGKAPIKSTYFSQSLLGEAPGLEELLDEEQYNTFIQEAGTNEDTARERQMRLVQHLLARFAERLSDFRPAGGAEPYAAPQAFLNEYPAMSYQRFRAFDHRRDSWENDNVSGLKRRLYHLLGFPRPERQFLSELNEDSPGGFHLLEHVLLRPSGGDEEQKSPILLLPFKGDEQRPPERDPYSLQLSFVFPAWLDGLKEEQGHNWQFVLRTLREQTPAHLRIYVHRLQREDMKAFETAYRQWITQLKLRQP